MSGDTNGTERAVLDLSRPSEALASNITRELGWDERIEGWVFDPGPGLVLQRIYRLGHLSSFFDAVPNFTVDLPRLREWLRDTVGDAELSDAVDQAIAATRTVSEGDEPNDPRRAVADLLRHRVQQCKQVLDGEASVEATGVGDE